MLSTLFKARRLAVVMIALASAGLASAEISHVIFRIEATNAAGAGTFEATSDQLTYNPGTGAYTWTQPAQVVLENTSGETIAILRSANLALVDEPARTPRIIMNWAAMAGESQTTFKIYSPLLSYAPIPAALASGKATASFSVTDQNQNGASLAGLDPPHGLGIYTAKYNGFVPGGTLFSNLLAEITAGPGMTGTGSQNDPIAGSRPINADVTSMSALAAFTLTANDLMSGNTGFVILPEPAAAWFFAALMVAIRRR